MEITMNKLAIISDIHGNYKALEAFLAYLTEHPVDGIVALGDYVTDSPYPERTMDLIYQMREQYRCYMIRGNREEYLLNNQDNVQGWKPSSANGSLFYTWERIREQDRRFFASLPTEKEISFSDCETIFICHGTPGNVRGNVTEEPGLRERVLQETTYRYILGGHSHHQEKYCQDNKTYINPGSLGLAIDGVGGRAQFAILTSQQFSIPGMDTEGKRKDWQTELISLQYDLDSFLMDFERSGIDEMGMTLNKAVKKSLLTGVNYFLYCIQEMEALAKEAGEASIAKVPEERWRQLEKKFGL